MVDKIVNTACYSLYSRSPGQAKVVSGTEAKELDMARALLMNDLLS